MFPQCQGLERQAVPDMSARSDEPHEIKGASILMNKTGLRGMSLGSAAKSRQQSDRAPVQTVLWHRQGFVETRGGDVRTPFPT
jgi:hypothetical protein